MNYSKFAGYALAGLFLIAIKATQENYGFSNVGGSEAMGFNAFTLFMYGAGVYLIFYGYKQAKKVEEVKK